VRCYNVLMLELGYRTEASLEDDEDDAAWTNNNADCQLSMSGARILFRASLYVLLDSPYHWYSSFASSRFCMDTKKAAKGGYVNHMLYLFSRCH
jgi:hypothetical protein